MAGRKRPKRGAGRMSELRSGGHVYTAYDAYENKRYAKSVAKQARRVGLGPAGTKTLVRVLYAGPDYRLKWTLYVCIYRPRR